MNRFAPTPGQPGNDPSHRMRAVLASVIFHALLLAFIVGLVLYHPGPRPPLSSGSAQSTTSLSLSKLVIVSSPLPSPVTDKKTPVPPAPPTPEVTATPPAKIPPTGRSPDAGVPILAEAAKSAEVPLLAIHTHARPPAPHHATAVSTEVTPAPSAPSTVASSYAPGANTFPHPPYPDEARYLRETGTVVVKVRFNAEGDVAQVDLERSSGVSLLDRETRSYIRQSWHSVPYAGQTLSVPVEYTLQNL